MADHQNNQQARTSFPYGPTTNQPISNSSPLNQHDTTPTEIRLVSAIRKSAWRAPASTKATAAVVNLWYWECGSKHSVNVSCHCQ